MAPDKRKNGSWLDGLGGVDLSGFGDAGWWGFLILLVLCLVVAIVWLVRWRRRDRVRSLLQRGLCPKCEYDLRASEHRCPECGKLVPRRILVERRRLGQPALQ
jgi:hypothetical protein